jgi:hypothetical protein
MGEQLGAPGVADQAGRSGLGCHAGEELGATHTDNQRRDRSGDNEGVAAVHSVLQLGRLQV